LSEISAAIAAAIEQQGAATQEIARNVQAVAVGTCHVSSNVQTVTQSNVATLEVGQEMLAALVTGAIALVWGASFMLHDQILSSESGGLSSVTGVAAGCWLWLMSWLSPACAPAIRYGIKKPRLNCRNNSGLGGMWWKIA